MTNILALLALTVVPVGLFSSFLMLPRWCTRSLHRHRIWRLRDKVVDDVIADRLPQDNRCVQQLIRQLDSAAHNCNRMSMLEMRVYRRTLLANAEAAKLLRSAEEERRPRAGLSSAESGLVDAYQEQLVSLLSGTLLLGSWFGLAHVAWFLPRVVIAEARATRREDLSRIESIEAEIRTTGRRATDMAVTSTRLGHRTTEWAQAKRELLATT